MLTNYIKIAWKVLLRHPFYTFITLFGISFTLTVLVVLTSFLDHLFGAHYPEDRRSRMLYIGIVVRTDSANTSMSSGPASFDFLTRYAKSLKSPERVAIVSNFSFTNTYMNGKRIKLYTKYTDADFWRVTDFRFLEGKPFNEQNITNADRVAVITDDLRDQYFEKGAPVVGKFIDIENINYRVIGVVKGSPPTRLYTYGDVYFPYTAPKSNYENKGIMGRYVALILGKTKADIPAIQAEFSHTISKIPLQEIKAGGNFQVLKVQADTFYDHVLDIFTRGEANTRLFFYAVAALFVLMIMGLPAINLVNVNISRILERASEIGVRKAFGAASAALLWQFIIENIFITLIGGVFALVLSFSLITMINSSGWIAYADLEINIPVFLTSLVVCLIFGLMSGVFPAFRMSKLKIADALKG